VGDAHPTFLVGCVAATVTYGQHCQCGMAVTHRGDGGEGRTWSRCVLAAIVDRDVRGFFEAKTHPTPTT
jgi:hypothetical protein